jgi:threonine/homoserine/homoserine lactone efflux protein
MAYLAALTLGHGRRAGLAAVTGVALGLALIGLAAAMGFAALVAASPVLWNALRWAGTAYLFYLAWETWRDETETSPAGLQTEALEHRRYFLRGLITNVLNPKAALFYVAILPRFLPDNEAGMQDAVLLTLISVAIATIVHLAIVFLAAPLHPVLSQPARVRITRRVLALGLAGIGLWFLAGSGLPGR